MREDWYYTPEEVAQVICESTYDDCDQFDPRFRETVEALHELSTDPKFATFYETLQEFTNINEGLLK